MLNKTSNKSDIMNQWTRFKILAYTVKQYNKKTFNHGDVFVMKKYTNTDKINYFIACESSRGSKVYKKTIPLKIQKYFKPFINEKAYLCYN